MSVWDELTVEQYAVMINAIEEAYLNGVVYEYNRRVNGQVKVGDVPVARPDTWIWHPDGDNHMVMLMTTDR